MTGAGESHPEAVSGEGLRRLCTAIFRAGGSEEAEAALVAEHLVAGNLTGHDSHGVVLLSERVAARPTTNRMLARSSIGASIHARPAQTGSSTPTSTMRSRVGSTSCSKNAPPRSVAKTAEYLPLSR